MDEVSLCLKNNKNNNMNIFGRSVENEMMGGVTAKKDGGNIIFYDKRLSHIGEPEEYDDAVPKHYVDERISHVIETVAIKRKRRGEIDGVAEYDYDFQGRRLKNIGEAEDKADAVSKRFVQDIQREFSEQLKVEREQTEKLMTSTKTEFKNIFESYEKKIPPRLMESLPEVGSSGNYIFHNRLIRKVGEGIAPTDVVNKSQLDEMLQQAKTYADGIVENMKIKIDDDMSQIIKYARIYSDNLYARGKKNVENIINTTKEKIKNILDEIEHSPDVVGSDKVQKLIPIEYIKKVLLQVIQTKQYEKKTQ